MYLYYTILHYTGRGQLNSVLIAKNCISSF